MNSYKILFCSLATATMLAGCSKEDPFTVDQSGQTGTLMTRCLAPKLTNTDGVEMRTRAEVPIVGEFNVVITRQGVSTFGSEPGSVEYKYSEMPEVLTLPVGEYKVYAHHGKNNPAAWEEPYYYGESEFGIDANKITDDVDPIVAKLANIRVTIIFHPSLLSAMSDDSKVVVNAGNLGVMEFKPSESRSAYFRYEDKSQTLAATFTGTVDGTEVVETHTAENVAPGHHYKITFKMHGIDDDDPGTIDGSINVDTSVEQVDMNNIIPGEEEEYLEDDLRPGHGSGDDPGPGPDDPTPTGPKPRAEALEPTGEYAGYKKLDLDADNKITDDLYCAWKVISEAEGGFDQFDVEIKSTSLTPGELSSVGLKNESEDPKIFKMNLITPGDNEAVLGGLGFPVNVGGQPSAEFDITDFLSLILLLGEGKHEFILTVHDSNGTSIISIKLHN